MLRNQVGLWLAPLGLTLLAQAGFAQYGRPNGPAYPGRPPVYGQAPVVAGRVQVGTLQYFGGLHHAGMVRLGSPAGYEPRSVFHHPYATSWGFAPAYYGPTYASYVSWYPDYSSYYPDDYGVVPVGYPYYDYSYYVSSGYAPYTSLNPLPVPAPSAPGPLVVSAPAPAPATITSPIVPAVAPAVEGKSAHVQVTAPEGATVTFNGQSVAGREFDTPALEEGKKYDFTVRALWYEGNRLVSSERVVNATAGGKIAVDFTKR